MGGGSVFSLRPSIGVLLVPLRDNVHTPNGESISDRSGVND